MATLLLFGAGASHGSKGLNKTPPLGEQLYTALANEFPKSWGSFIPDDVGKLLAKDFELGMDELHRQPSSHDGLDVNRLLREMALYFSEFRVSQTKINEYCNIARRFKARLLNHSLVIGTLNYECLIELALGSAGMNVSYWGKLSGARVLKPHGSCNFIPENISGSATGLIANLAGAKINTPIRAVFPDQVKAQLQNMFLPVAMSLFTREKTDLIAPGHIKKIRAEFGQRASEVKTIITVGVRPNPLDIHIWEPIAKSPAKVFLIAGRTECDDWISNYKSKNAEFIGERMDTCFDRLCEVLADSFR